MISQYQKEIDEFLKNGGTITQDHNGSTVEDMMEGKLLQESVTTVRDYKPHEVTAISWDQAMAETDSLCCTDSYCDMVFSCHESCLLRMALSSQTCD